MQFQFLEYRVPRSVAAGDWGSGHEERVETPVHVDTLALPKENNFRKLLWKRLKQFQETVVEKIKTISGNCCGKGAAFAGFLELLTQYFSHECWQG